MDNTLLLDDELDSVELLQNLERLFEIKVSDDDVECIRTVGDVHDLLLRKVPPNETNRKCASAMSFYRIRAALRRLGYGDTITPAFNMHVRKRERIKLFLMKLESESGLRLPGAISTRIGGSTALYAFMIILALVFSLQPGFTSACLGIIAGLIVSHAILEADPGNLPPDCDTLAEITRIAARMNYGRLVKLGARHRDEDIWKALVEALSGYDLPKSEITRETVLLQGQF